MALLAALTVPEVRRLLEIALPLSPGLTPPLSPPLLVSSQYAGPNPIDISYLQ